MWHIMNGVDEATCKKVNLHERCIFLEMCVCLNMEGADSVKDAEAKPRDKPRLIQTHLPFELLPPDLLEKANVVYVSRNPKDACVSWYYHNLTFGKEHYGFTGDFKDMAALWRNGGTLNGDYFHHVQGAWSRRYHPNLKFLWFEDMKRDLVPVIKDLCNFYQLPLTAEKIKELERIMVVDKFRENYAASETTEETATLKKNFIRKGQIGDWKNHFTAEMSTVWDAWIQQNIEGTGIPLQFE